MIKSTFSLPSGYRRKLRIDLQNDKKRLIGVNVVAMMIMAVLIVAGLLLRRRFEASIPALLASVVSIFLYMVGHEAVHGICIRYYSGKWGNFGFKGAYAFAGSQAYFAKTPYAVIALAPVVFFGVLFALVGALWPALFWPAYILQVVNLSGAAGDYYVCTLLLGMPRETLVRDEGTAMDFYVKESTQPKD